MKRISEIIRELMEEDAYIRENEAKIIRFYAKSSPAARKGPQTVKCKAAAPVTAGVDSR